jgi:hypothetical protein
MNANEPISPNDVANPPNHPINPYPSAVPFNAQGYTVRYADSTTTTTPPKLSGWYSNNTFKVVAFFLLTVGILATSTIGFYNSRLSADQWIGIVGSLLMLSAPSPLQMIKKQKKQPIIIQQGGLPV